MKAKDTVMSDDYIMAISEAVEDAVFSGQKSDTKLVAIAKAQAKISFKVGKTAGVKAGIKEVVEWEQLYPYETRRSPNGRICRVISIPLDEWQAKLKEWEV